MTPQSEDDKSRNISPDSEHHMGESFSLSDQKMKEPNGNIEDDNNDNNDNGNMTTETGSGSDEVNI